MRHLAPLLIATLTCCLAGRSLAAEPEPIKLFNGKDLAGWHAYLVEPDVTMEDVWSVKDGLLICTGEPMGYLATKADYKNFKLIVEWRWPAGKEPGNSGVLMRITGEPMALPRCVEAQLRHGSAGDIWAFQGFHVEGDAAHFSGDKSSRVRESVGSEQDHGQ